MNAKRPKEPGRRSRTSSHEFRGENADVLWLFLRQTEGGYTARRIFPTV